MTIKFIKNIILFCIIVCTSCVEEYSPDLEKYENILVVAGMITNKPGPYTIKLSISSPLDSTLFIPKTNALIIIFDDNGNSETLTEIKPGEYSTSASGIQGIVGRKYKIQIKTPENKTYSSDFEELYETVEIDRVYYNIENKESEFYYYDLVGLQFYLDTKLASRDENYFLWKLESTFEYNSSYRITNIFDGIPSPNGGYYIQGRLYNCNEPYMLYKCWKTEANAKMYTSNTIGMSELKITNFPLNFVSTENEELTIKYSLLVKQMTVSKKIHDFWHNINEINYNQGSIFSSLPYQVRGNLICENNIEEPVLGYFMVAGISEKRIFVNRPNINFTYKDCELTEGDFKAFPYVYTSFEADWPIYITTNEYGSKAWPNQDCIDCTRKGGTTTKPYFWTD